MCLIAFAYDAHPKYRLIMAANRDEFYGRPTAPAHFWEDHPKVLAGRDLEKMGTWMGVTKGGRFAAITNYRDPSEEMPDARSRGTLVSDYLTSNELPGEYLAKVKAEKDKYNGFNLILGDRSSIYYFSNQADTIQELSPGIYGLSNAALDTPWPKVTKSKKRLSECMSQESVSSDCLFDLLADDKRADDQILPETGVGTELERILSSVFIQTEGYGTRASTALMIDRDNHVFFKERSFSSGQQKPSDVAEYDFQLEDRA